MKSIFVSVIVLVVLIVNISAAGPRFQCVDTKFGRYCSTGGCVEYENEVRCGPGCVTSEHGHVCGDNCICYESGCGCGNTPAVEPVVVNPPVQRPDERRPDLRRPDLRRPVSARPDLARPELSRPDLVRPDVARPDVARPDLAIPVALNPYQGYTLTDPQVNPRSRSGNWGTPRY